MSEDFIKAADIEANTPICSPPAPGPGFDAEAMSAAYRFVETMVARADIALPFPAWHGWALREAFIAGAKFVPPAPNERNGE